MIDVRKQLKQYEKAADKLSGTAIVSGKVLSAKQITTNLIETIHVSEREKVQSIDALKIAYNVLQSAYSELSDEYIELDAKVGKLTKEKP